LPSAELATRKPDIVVILAWIYADPIINRNIEYIRNGGAFLVPLPVAKKVDKRGVSALD
jgi:hypothetical protein